MTSSNTPRIFRPAKFALLAVGVALAGAATAAQQLEPITVEGSRMTKEVVGRSSSTGARIELVTLVRHASYSDLDLSTHSGAVELQERVELTAKAACKELDELFPFNVSSNDTRSCVNKAVRSAKAQVQAAIKSAEEARVAAK
jgi:UrcA family protein